MILHFLRRILGGWQRRAGSDLAPLGGAEGKLADDGETEPRAVRPRLFPFDTDSLFGIKVRQNHYIPPGRALLRCGKDVWIWEIDRGTIIGPGPFEFGRLNEVIVRPEHYDLICNLVPRRIAAEP